MEEVLGGVPRDPHWEAGGSLCNIAWNNDEPYIPCIHLTKQLLFAEASRHNSWFSRKKKNLCTTLGYIQLELWVGNIPFAD